MIKIVDKSKCSGCHSCYNICPKKCIIMKEDQEGFWYPEVDVNQCINCGLCEKRCPILNDMKVDNQPQAYACYNKDEIIRKGSSSGGVLTLLASLVIEKGGIVYGATFNNENMVEHIKVDNINDLNK